MALIDTSKLPIETKEIFDTLRRGNFIVDNHPDSHQKRLYSVCDSHHSLLFSYFDKLGYELTGGEGYFLFTVSDMPESAKENRIDRVLELLDFMELFHGVFPTFSIGWRGFAAELATALKSDAIRYEKLENARISKGKSLQELCEKVFNEMERFGIMVPINDNQNNYMVTSAYNYAKEFFESVQRINTRDDEAIQ